MYSFLLLSPVPLFFFRSLMFRYEGLSHSQCFSLITSDPILTFHCSSASFIICHPKDVISLNTSIHTWIPWNRLTMTKCFIFIFFYTVEYIHFISFILLFLSFIGLSFRPHTEKRLLVLDEGLSLNYWVSLCSRHTVKLIKSLRRNWMLQMVK